ncbi:hypothetical protein [Plantactinospora soyae]|uniref:DNA-binding HxlR family transcriptional regulator n=1 Tax=Plantactinospora soyae TaxID=1544732 RepID=A0A927M5L6_9ACTN|nr:hypothetical protein [Plantactinospora soyae]MBE1487407.1 DNA-binding HxlR family transcriptional regulator [Plantactinospora soyae]
MAGTIRLDDHECPPCTALGYVGEGRTLPILYDAFDGYRRFAQFPANPRV